MELRHLVEQDFPQQREVFGLSFPETIGTPIIERPFYEWKFRSVPASPPSYEYVYLEDGKMLGYYAALPMRYKVGSGEYTAGLVLDVMTHPEARGKGVFVKTGRFALDEMKDAGIAFTTGYPIRPEVLPGHLKVGWKVSLELPMYLRVLRANSVIRGRLPGFIAPVLNPFLGLMTGISRLWRGSSRGVEHLSVEEALNVEAFWKFFERFHAVSKNVWLRDRESLGWRLRRPDAAYRVLVHRSPGGDVDGMLIARLTELKGVTTLAILDLASLDDAATSALLLEAERLASREKLDTLSTMVSRPMAKRLGLARHLFLPSPFVFKLIVKPLADDSLWEALLDADAWHLGWIDTDDL